MQNYCKKSFFKKGYEWKDGGQSYYEQSSGYFFASPCKKLLRTTNSNYFKDCPHDREIGVEYIYDEELDDFVPKISKKKTKYLFDV